MTVEYNFEPHRIWFTSDTHFGHANIIKFCNRPFRDVTEMNEEIIRRWNETVPEDGLVFHLGDFCYGGSKEWNDVMYRLHGKIYLILGNHDFKNIRSGYTGRFEHITQQMSIRVGGQGIILNHNPFLCYGGSYRDVWQLFGHVHSGPRSNTGLDHARLQYLFPRQYDVGVDNNDFRPVSFYEVKEKIEAQVRRAQEEAGVHAFIDNEGPRNIVFLDSAIAPKTKAQKSALGRIAEETAARTLEISATDGESLKEAIGRRISAIGGGARYVYLGPITMNDFRQVTVDAKTGITEQNVDDAISLLR